MACLQKIFVFLTELGNFKQKIFRGNAIGNVANHKSIKLPRPDDSGNINCSFSIYVVILLNSKDLNKMDSFLALNYLVT